MASLADQLYAFGMTIVAGAAMGAVFDLFRILRGSASSRGVVAWIGDMLYWLSVTPIVATLLLYANGGQLRFYVVLGIAAGVIVYFTVFGPVVRETFRLAFRIAGAVASWAVHLVLYVVAWPVVAARRIGYAWRSPAAGGARLALGTGWRTWLRTAWRPNRVWRPDPAWRRR